MLLPEQYQLQTKHLTSLVTPDFLFFFFSFLAKIPGILCIHAKIPLSLVHSVISLFFDCFGFSFLCSAFFGLSLFLLYKLRKCQSNMAFFSKNIHVRSLKNPSFWTRGSRGGQGWPSLYSWKGLRYVIQLKTQ